jgi:hypothetical protein
VTLLIYIQFGVEVSRPIIIGVGFLESIKSNGILYLQ